MIQCCMQWNSMQWHASVQTQQIMFRNSTDWSIDSWRKVPFCPHLYTYIFLINGSRYQLHFCWTVDRILETDDETSNNYQNDAIITSKLLHHWLRSIRFASQKLKTFINTIIHTFIYIYHLFIYIYIYFYEEREIDV